MNRIRTRKSMGMEISSLPLPHVKHLGIVRWRVYQWIALPVLLCLVSVWRGEGATGPLDTWHPHSSPLTHGLSGLAFGSPAFVGAGFNVNEITRSTNGAQWSLATLPEGRPTRMSFANGHFLTLTQPPQAVLFESADGLVWKNLAEDLPRGKNFGIFDYANGLYLAAAHSTVYHSTDLQHWTSSTGVPKGNIFSLSHAGGRWIAGMDFGLIATSDDGKAWRTNSLGAKDSRIWTTAGGGTFVAVSSAGHIWTSADGDQWGSVYQPAGPNHGLHGVAFGNGRFVACGAGGAILTSTDGRTWTSKTSGTKALLRQVEYGLNTFVISGEDGFLQSDPLP